MIELSEMIAELRRELYRAIEAGHDEQLSPCLLAEAREAAVEIHNETYVARYGCLSPWHGGQCQGPPPMQTMASGSCWPSTSPQAASLACGGHSGSMPTAYPGRFFP